MLDKSIVALINSDLDGVASPGDRARLERILAENKEARKYADDLCALTRGLAAVERGVVPPTLRPAIMRSITGTPAAARRKGYHPFGEIAWRVEGNLKSALVFAGGMVAGLLLFAVGSRVMAPGSIEEKDLVGSLAVHGSTFSAGRIVEFNNGDLHASVQAGMGTGQTIVRIRLDVPPGTLTVLTYADGNGHVETVDVQKANRAQISLEQGRIVVQGVSSGEVGILFRGNAEVLAGARLLFSDGYGGEWGIPLEDAVAR